MTNEELQKNIRVREDGCWIWTGNRTNFGYGKVQRAMLPGEERTTFPAHREVWELLVGPIPRGLLLDHLCRSRACVNPDHLELVTPRENLLRSPRTLAAKNAAKTHCPRGHELAGPNLRTERRGTRVLRSCRTCYNAMQVRVRREKIQARLEAAALVTS